MSNLKYRKSLFNNDMCDVEDEYTETLKAHQPKKSHSFNNDFVIKSSRGISGLYQKAELGVAVNRECHSEDDNEVKSPEFRKSINFSIAIHNLSAEHIDELDIKKQDVANLDNLPATRKWSDVKKYYDDQSSYSLLMKLKTSN